MLLSRVDGKYSQIALSLRRLKFYIKVTLKKFVIYYLESTINLYSLSEIRN